MEGNTSSLVQSDGVLILPENTELESLTVNDGAPCSEGKKILYFLLQEGIILMTVCLFIF